MHAKVLRRFATYLSLLILSACVTETPSHPPATSTVEPLAALHRDREPVVFTDEAQYVHAFRIYVRRNLIIPPGTPRSAGAAVEVVVSPKGEVRKLVITQSSGYSRYDRAVERAVFKAQPLPVMQEWVVSNRSEKLILKFKASE
jgi:TonB family protein